MNTDDIACVVCQLTFLSHEELAGHASQCQQIKQEEKESSEDNKVKSEQEDQEDFKYEINPPDFSENGDSDYKIKEEKKKVKKPKVKKTRKKKPKIKDENDEFMYWNPLDSLDGSNLELSEDFIFFILRQVDVLCENIRNGDPDQERTLEVNRDLNKAVSCYRSKLDSKIQNFITESMDQDYYDNNDMDFEPKPKSKPKKSKNCAEMATQNKVCHVCGFSTLTQASLNKHILVKHEKDKHKQCPHCSYHRASLREIEYHIDDKHPELYDKRFDCHHCSKSFIFERSLKHHLDKMQVRKQLECKLCGVKFLKIQELLDHVPEIHPDKMQNPTKTEIPIIIPDRKVKISNVKEVCEFCNSEWDSIDLLKAHDKQVHQDGKFKCCSYCDHKSLVLCNLRYHIEKNHPHHGPKKFLCDVCGEGFMFLQNVKKHKVDIHRKLRCHMCGKECKNNQRLRWSTFAL